MTVELPTTLLRRVRRQLVAATARTTSPFTGTQQVQDWGGRWWEYDLEFAVTQGAEARRLSVFFDALAGGVGTFVLRDPTAARAGGLGTAAVMGAAQTGQYLTTDGWTATGLLAGDFITVEGYLYRLAAPAYPSGGIAVLTLVPKLRVSPADNAAINYTSPGVILRPSGPIPTDIDRVDKHAFSFRAREAI